TVLFFFFLTATAPPGISTLSLHDALPIYVHLGDRPARRRSRGLGVTDPSGAAAGAGRPQRRDHRHGRRGGPRLRDRAGTPRRRRSEEHTSELQSPCNLVCRLLLEKKKKEL